MLAQSKNALDNIVRVIHGRFIYVLLRERERRKTLILIHVIDYLQLRSIYIYTSLGELTTIHVTYIKKERLYIIYTLYSTSFILSWTRS